MEDIIKTTAKKYLDEETTGIDIDGILSDVYGKEFVDQVNREMSAANNLEEGQEQTNQLPIPNILECLRQQLADAQKTIEEQTQTIKGIQAENEQLREQLKQPFFSAENEDVEKLKTDLEHYKSISETYQDIIITSKQ